METEVTVKTVTINHPTFLASTLEAGAVGVGAAEASVELAAELDVDVLSFSVDSSCIMSKNE